VSDLIQAFGQSPYVSAAANAIQIATIPLAFWAWYHLTCRIPWCMRHGQHPVAGTSWKVCSRHHLKEHHDHLRSLHALLHPDRLHHGES
jgi:hypothetical protein